MDHTEITLAQGGAVGVKGMGFRGVKRLAVAMEDALGGRVLASVYLRRDECERLAGLLCSAPNDATGKPDATHEGMDDFVARALYYFSIAFDANSMDRLKWEQLPDHLRTDYLMQARTAIEAFTDWRYAHGLVN